MEDDADFLAELEHQEMAEQQLGEEMDELREQLVEATERASGFEARIDELDDELRHAEQVIAEKEIVIGRLRAKVEKLEKELTWKEEVDG